MILSASEDIFLEIVYCKLSSTYSSLLQAKLDRKIGNNVHMYHKQAYFGVVVIDNNRMLPF